MFDLKNISKALTGLVAEKEKVQARLDELLKRQNELRTIPLPKDDFIAMIIEEQGLREDQLSYRIYQKYRRRINEPMGPLHIRDIHDSPLAWPVGTGTIPNDVWHVLFGEQINKVLIEAMEKWTEWPEVVGPTRAKRFKEMAVIEEEIAELREWLQQAAQLAGAA